MSDGILPSYLTPDDNQKALGITPLHISVGLFEVSDETYTGEQSMLEALEATGDINKADKAGNTAMHSAALIQMTGAAKFLLDNGAQVDVVNNNHETPLFRCISRSPEKELVDLLLAAGADPYLKGRYDQNVLEYVKENPSRERLDALRQYFTPEEIIQIEEGIKERDRINELAFAEIKKSKKKIL